jgi:hypothetical protein
MLCSKESMDIRLDGGCVLRHRNSGKEGEGDTKLKMEGVETLKGRPEGTPYLDQGRSLFLYRIYPPASMLATYLPWVERHSFGLEITLPALHAILLLAYKEFPCAYPPG